MVKEGFHKLSRTIGLSHGKEKYNPRLQTLNTKSRSPSTVNGKIVIHSCLLQIFMKMYNTVMYTSLPACTDR